MNKKLDTRTTSEKVTKVAKDALHEGMQISSEALEKAADGLIDKGVKAIGGAMKKATNKIEHLGS